MSLTHSLNSTPLRNLRKTDLLGIVAVPTYHRWKYETPLHVCYTERLEGSIIQGPYKKAGGLSRGFASQLSKEGVVFGLVWGNSENPEDERDLLQKKMSSYKLSTYLSAGLPVVVPNLLSNADYIRDKGLGFVASVLKKPIRLVQDCTEEEYAQMVERLQYTSYLIHNGYFYKEIIVDTIIVGFGRIAFNKGDPSDKYEGFLLNTMTVVPNRGN